MESFEGAVQEKSEVPEESPGQWLEVVLPFSHALGVLLALAFVFGRIQSARHLLRSL